MPALAVGKEKECSAGSKVNKESLPNGSTGIFYSAVLI